MRCHKTSHLDLECLFSQWSRREWSIIIIILLSQYYHQSQFHHVIMIIIWSVTNIVKTTFQEGFYTTIGPYCSSLSLMLVNITPVILFVVILIVIIVIMHLGDWYRWWWYIYRRCCLQKKKESVGNGVVLINDYTDVNDSIVRKVWKYHCYDEWTEEKKDGRNIRVPFIIISYIFVIFWFLVLVFLVLCFSFLEVLSFSIFRDTLIPLTLFLLFLSNIILLSRIATQSHYLFSYFKFMIKSIGNKMRIWKGTKG